MSNKVKSKRPNPAKRQSTPSAWPKRIAAVAGIGVAAVIVGIVVFSPTPIFGVPDGTETLEVGAPQHVEGDLHAEGEVPAGGAHDAVWQNCGFYDSPVRSENAVHSLEHGAVWISYDPTLASDEVDRLRAFAGTGDKVLISQVAGQPAPVIATAWATQLELADAGDPRLEQFVNEFEGSLDAPEPGGACRGGIGSPVG